MKKCLRFSIPKKLLLILLITLPCLSFIRNSISENFRSVRIGKQVWMAENLNADKFRNGDIIPEVKNNHDWVLAQKNHQPAWCYYEYNRVNGEIYGKLYNWNAINDKRGLAPIGWHVGSNSDWDILIKYLGGAAIAGKKIMSTHDWVYDNDATNESGFNALPGGHLECGEGGGNDYAAFRDKGIGFNFWTSNDFNIWSAYYKSINTKEKVIAKNKVIPYTGIVSKDTYKESGMYVRCIKN